jgi:hypothetical protein
MFVSIPVRAGVLLRRPWNAGRKLGAKRALKQQQVWAIRFWLLFVALHRDQPADGESDLR